MIRTVIRNNEKVEWQPPVVGLTEEEVYDLRSQSNTVWVESIDALVEERIERIFGRKEVHAGDAEESRVAAREDLSKTSQLVHVPWLNQILRYPGVEEHREVRTWRNRNLITKEEQQRLFEARIAVIGLSVGSNIVDQLSQSGIGGAFLLADRDRVSPSNLNRIRASMADVGLKKTIVAGRKLALTDPYIEQLHLPEGYVEGETDEILEDWQPDLIFDEVDDLNVKAMIRRLAEKIGVPVVMAGDIGERSILDVERYDEADRILPFNGKISDADYQRLLSGEALSREEMLQLLVQLNGQENISDRLFASAFDQNLGGLPQLGATAAAGAALADRVSRAILLGDDIKSGTYVHNPDELLKLN